MIRVTVSLDDELAATLKREAARRQVTVSWIVRDALRGRLGLDGSTRRPLPFRALGRSGTQDTARRAEEILHERWRDR